MNEILGMILSIFAGILLGIFFFGGLWWTVQNKILSKWSSLWFVGSFFIRITITLFGFYFISAGHWQRMVLCLIGFILARWIVVRITTNQSGVNHAS